MIGMMIATETEILVETATAHHAGEMTATVIGTKEEEEEEEEEIATGTETGETDPATAATVHQGEETTATDTVTVAVIVHPAATTTAHLVVTETDPLVVTALTGPRKKSHQQQQQPLPQHQVAVEEKK